MDKLAEELYIELINLIRHQIGAHEMPITIDTLIEDDLGVSGDDASDLIMTLSKGLNLVLMIFIFKNISMTNRLFSIPDGTSTL